MNELRSHLGRRLDPAWPSNRHILILSGAFLACSGLAGLLRPAPDDGPERAMLAAIRAGECGAYGWVAGALLAPIADPALQIRLLRGYNALLGTMGVFSAWALARELLPDQPQFATPVAALAAIQPATWQLATSANPIALEMLSSNGMLMVICRVASRSTGLAPTTLDQLMVAAGAAFTALLAPELKLMPALLALAAGYDGLRDGDRRGALLGAGAALVGMAPAIIRRRAGRSARLAEPVAPAWSRRALGGLAIGGLLGATAALVLHGRDAVRSRADDGGPLATDAVLVARGLAFGWTALRLAQRDDRAALDVIAPLCCGAVAGIAALAQALRAR